MRKFLVLFIFLFITALNVVFLFSFSGVLSQDNLTYSEKTLDFSRDFSVTIDLEFLKKNLEPAYE